MAWDVLLDGRTGEWVFTANRDLMGIGGELHIQQRIMTRLRIKRGSFQYDVDGNLGSRLDIVTHYQPERAILEIPAYVREALAPMEEIQVHDVTAIQNPDNPTEIQVQVSYLPAGQTGQNPQYLNLSISTG